MSKVPPPEGPPVAPTSAELQLREGRRAGRTKGGNGCRTTLPLLAPLCGETIDVMDFRLRWASMPSESGNTLSLIIGNADSFERKRWNAIPVGGQEFSDNTMHEYLARIQSDHPTDISLRLMRTETLDAVRLLHLPSKGEYGGYKERLAAASRLPELARNISLLNQFLEFGMWSKAADVAEHLALIAPKSPEIQKFALIGFCRAQRTSQIEATIQSLGKAHVVASCDSPSAKGAMSQ